jgi:protein SCO1
MSSTIKQFATVVTLAVLCLAAAGASAQIMKEPPVKLMPPDLKDVSIHQQLGVQLPLNLHFKDESGKTVQLGDYFNHGRPVILNFVYFECPMLCTEALNGLSGTLRMLKLNVGSDFDVVTLSFDTRETPQLAREKKAAYIERYGRPGASEGWHFLTGDDANVKALTNAAGFHFKWDEKSQQWAHATAIMIVTPQGKLAQYYYGIEYPPKDVRLGLIEASQNKMGNLVDEILLYCYHYDPRTGRYGAVITNVIRLGGAVTIVLLGGFLIVMFRREKKPPNAAPPHAAGPADHFPAPQANASGTQMRGRAT